MKDWIYCDKKVDMSCQEVSENIGVLAKNRLKYPLMMTDNFILL